MLLVASSSFPGFPSSMSLYTFGIYFVFLFFLWFQSLGGRCWLKLVQGLPPSWTANIQTDRQTDRQTDIYMHTQCTCLHTHTQMYTHTHTHANTHTHRHTHIHTYHFCVSGALYSSEALRARMEGAIGGVYVWFCVPCLLLPSIHEAIPHQHTCAKGTLYTNCSQLAESEMRPTKKEYSCPHPTSDSIYVSFLKTTKSGLVPTIWDIVWGQYLKTSTKSLYQA